jgi:hypothetical protein
LFQFALTGSVTQVVDSAAAPLSVDTQNKETLFLIGDTVAASISSRSPLIRFGRIKYSLAGERRTFDPTGRQDTALVRFVNASTNVGGRIKFQNPQRPAADTVSLAFSGISTYRNLPAPTPATYTFYVSRSGAVIDSVSIQVSKLKRYTTVVLDSANVWSIKTYGDE